MTSKQRAALRAKASLIDTIMIIGKCGLNEEICNQASDAIKTRELIKGKVLETSMVTALEAGNYIADKIGADLICSIGNKFVLYKKNNKLKTKAIKKPFKKNNRIKNTKIKRAESKKTKNKKLKTNFLAKTNRFSKRTGNNKRIKRYTRKAKV